MQSWLQRNENWRMNALSSKRTLMILSSLWPKWRKRNMPLRTRLAVMPLIAFSALYINDVFGVFIDPMAFLLRLKTSLRK